MELFLTLDPAVCILTELVGVHVLGRVSHSAGEHSLWTAQEDESDFTLPVRLVKRVTMGNVE